MPKQMHLALDVSWTQLESAWRLPGSRVGRHYPDVGLFEDIARIAERGTLSVVPSPRGHPVLIQAGGSKRGIWAAAGFVDHVFGAGKGIPLMAQQRHDMDAALRERGRDPEQVGIVWATKVLVGER